MTPSKSIALFASALFVGLVLTAGALVYAEEEQAPATQRSPSLLSEPVEVIYRGLLQDERGQPISAVLPLTFHLYRTSMSADPIWTEEHFVSVIDGRYQISLGRQTPLREQLLLGDRWLAVEITDEGEILRDQLTVTRPPGSERRPAAGGDGHVELADRALVADSALSLDGRTAEDIEEIANLALQRLGEHVADPNAHASSARYRIGSQRVVPDGAGGAGGTPFEVRCPPGHVVTGLEGRAGRLLDYMTVVCSPLE